MIEGFSAEFFCSYQIETDCRREGIGENQTGELIAEKTPNKAGTLNGVLSGFEGRGHLIVAG